MLQYFIQKSLILTVQQVISHHPFPCDYYDKKYGGGTGLEMDIDSGAMEEAVSGLLVCDSLAKRSREIPRVSHLPHKQ